MDHPAAQQFATEVHGTRCVEPAPDTNRAAQQRAPAAEVRAIALPIDGFHVRSVRNYQVRLFEVMLAQISIDDGETGHVQQYAREG